MGDIVIKNMDKQIVEQLTSKALLNGNSLEDYAKEILVSQVEPDKAMSKRELIQFADEFSKRVGLQKTDSTNLIREDRDLR